MLPNLLGITDVKEIATSEFEGFLYAELLFIHPFREGNGRTCRILANLMIKQQGYDGLKLERLDNEMFPKYVKAVQLASKRDYSLMEEIISALF